MRWAPALAHADADVRAAFAAGAGPHIELLLWEGFELKDGAARLEFSYRSASLARNHVVGVKLTDHTIPEAIAGARFAGEGARDWAAQKCAKAMASA